MSISRRALQLLSGNNDSTASKEAARPVIVELYHSFIRYKESIESKLTTFHALLIDIQAQKAGELSIRDQEYAVALRLRKDLLDLFVLVEGVGKRIKEDMAQDRLLQSKSGRLHEGVYAALIQFLQMHMFTLQLLPSPSTSTSKQKKKRASFSVQIDDVVGRALLDSITHMQAELDQISGSDEDGRESTLSTLMEHIEMLEEQLRDHLAVVGARRA